LLVKRKVALGSPQTAILEPTKVKRLTLISPSGLRRAATLA